VSSTAVPAKHFAIEFIFLSFYVLIAAYGADPRRRELPPELVIADSISGSMKRET
jgi:hypothetical protein